MSETEYSVEQLAGLLHDCIADACTVNRNGTVRLESVGVKSFARALRALADLGMVEIVDDQPGNVVARFRRRCRSCRFCAPIESLSSHGCCVAPQPAWARPGDGQPTVPLDDTGFASGCPVYEPRCGPCQV